MTENEKGIVYDNCIREHDRLAKDISDIKTSVFGGNIDDEKRALIKKKEQQMEEVLQTMKNLFLI